MRLAGQWPTILIPAIRRASLRLLGGRSRDYAYLPAMPHDTAFRLRSLSLAGYDYHTLSPFLL